MIAIVAALLAEHADRCRTRGSCGHCDRDFALAAQVEQLGYAAGPRALVALIGPTHPAALAAIPRQQDRGAVAA